MITRKHKFQHNLKLRMVKPFDKGYILIKDIFLQI